MCCSAIYWRVTTKWQSQTHPHVSILAGVCEKGGLTYENGEKLEVGCDSICTCNKGKMDCQDRCTGPFFRKGKRIDDPLCSEKSTDDPCCSVMVCASDTGKDSTRIGPGLIVCLF